MKAPDAPEAQFKLPWPDMHYVAAAIGWLELNAPSEAGEEIARLRPDLLDHPDVLELRWQICSSLTSWEAGLEVAEQLVQVAPDRVSGWIARAYASRRVKGGSIQKAWNALEPAYKLFPKEFLIPYNLACYAAQLGRMDEAWEWLHRAMEAKGDINLIKKMALLDQDLAGLREKLLSL